MRTNTIRTWVVVGVVEVLLSLWLIASAPRFLNSNKPILGFLIWLSVPTLLGSSGLYVVLRLVDAQRARNIFVSRFPEYSYLTMVDFLEFSAAHVAQHLEQFEAAKDDPDFQYVCHSPLDFLQGAKQK